VIPLGVVAAAGGVLETADWYVDARKHIAGLPMMVDQGPHKLHAKLGSVGGAAIVPVAGGGNALSLPGVNGNYASVPLPTASGNQNTYDFKVRAAPSYSYGSTQGLVGGSSTYQRLNFSAGHLSFIVLATPSTAVVVSATTSLDLRTVAPEGTPVWYRATYNMAAGTGQFFYSLSATNDPDDVTWVPLNTFSSADTTSVTLGQTFYGVGSGNNVGTATPAVGAVYAADLTVNAARTTVDFNQPTGTTSFQAATGQMITVASTGADTNDPLFLPWTGENYVYLPGTTGNYISTPDSPTTRFTGDLDVRSLVAPSVWTNGSVNVLLARYGAAGSQAFIFRVAVTGQLNLLLHDGTSTVNATSTVTVSGDVPLHLRATWRQSDGRVQFFISLDGVSWVQLGTDRPAAIAAMANVSVPLMIGGRGSGSTEQAEFHIYAAELRNGIDGPVVARFDASKVTSPYQTYRDEQGNDWTLNRSATGAKTAFVDRSMFLFRTDDFMEVPDSDVLDFGTGEEFTIVAALRRHGATASDTGILTKRNYGSTAQGYSLTESGGGWFIFSVGDGTTAAQAVTATHVSGETTVLVASRSWTPRRVAAKRNGAGGINGDGTTGDLRNSLPLTIGRWGTSRYADMEFFVKAIFRRALSDAEIAQLTAELGAAA
jgi:hypothetical protein